MWWVACVANPKIKHRFDWLFISLTFATDKIVLRETTKPNNSENINKSIGTQKLPEISSPIFFTYRIARMIHHDKIYYSSSLSVQNRNNNCNLSTILAFIKQYSLKCLSYQHIFQFSIISNNRPTKGLLSRHSHSFLVSTSERFVGTTHTSNT